jgi:hypothetical protein
MRTNGQICRETEDLSGLIGASQGCKTKKGTNTMKDERKNGLAKYRK